MIKKGALVILDVQNDFFPGGILATQDSDKIIHIINKYIKISSHKKLPIYLSKDWHPKQTKHFKRFGGYWPTHCIKNTKGAEFHPNLKLPDSTIIVSKGMDPNKHNYPLLNSIDSNKNTLLALLQSQDIQDIFIGGIFTDHSDEMSIFDALDIGFNLYLFVDAVRIVNIKPKNLETTIKHLLERGLKRMVFDKFLKLMNPETPLYQNQEYILNHLPSDHLPLSD
ncbi:MAG: isochorismatase family protein [bacterium]